MNWLTEYKNRSEAAYVITKQIKQLNKELKQIGTTNATEIIGLAVAEKLNLRYRRYHNGIGFFSKNKNGNYHSNPDYYCQIAGDIATEMRYYDLKENKWYKLPEEIDDIVDLISQKRLGMFPRF